MNPSLNQAKERYELQQLEAAITGQLDLTCQLLLHSPEVPVDTLTVVLELDPHGRTRVASLMFIPLDDSDVESLKLLQFYCETPIKVSPDAGAAVAQFLSAINLKLPIGTFCLTEESQVGYKYVYALGKFKTIEPEEFLETFLLWMFGLDGMSNLIEEVAEGQRSLAAALKILEE
jgi:hypothetical protein